jgi:hypothetical protein
MKTTMEPINLVVVTNAMYKTEDSFNCYLTSAQARQLAEHLLRKAELIENAGIEGAAVHVWSQGRDNEKLYCGGRSKARKGIRRKVEA